MNRITGRIGALLLMATAITSGCSGSNAEEDARIAQARQDSKPRNETIVIPSGTNVLATLDTQVSTETSASGDQFTATTIQPITVDGKTVVPVGSRIHGLLRDVQASGRIKGRARMTLAYEHIVSNGKTHAISAVPLTLQADSGTRSDVEKIAAGGVLGAIIGGIADGKDGALKGAAIGAGAGTIFVLATKGDDIELNPGQRLSIHMTTPTSITVAKR